MEGGELISEVHVPVQELGGQRGEGAYFREDTVHACTDVEETPDNVVIESISAKKQTRNSTYYQVINFLNSKDL